MQDCDSFPVFLGSPFRAGCLGAFSVKDQESMRLIVTEAEAEDLPVALCVNADRVEPPAIRSLSAAATSLAQQASVPVTVILSHARRLDLVKLALDCGFSTVMFDGSFLPLASNIEQTAKAVELAARVGVPLEGAIGAFSDFGKDNRGQCLISTLAAQFVRQTGIDSLAVTLPLDTGWGYKLDLELLSKIRQRVTGGLSLNDASLLAPQEIVGAMAIGVSRLSFDTFYRQIFAGSFLAPSPWGLRETIRQTLQLLRNGHRGRHAEVPDMS